MSTKHKKMLCRILASALIFGIATVLDGTQIIKNEYLYIILLFAAYFTVGWDILWRAVINIFHGKIFDENFLMSIATVGAIFIGEYSEAVFVMIFYQVGELFQSIAVGKSRRSIASLMQLRPDSAVVERSGSTVTVDPSQVNVGEIIVVRPGEKIPLDGVIVQGSSYINTVALTGESMPSDAKEGDDVLSGCINMSALIHVKVTKSFGESTASKILELVENSTANKAKSENFITRFARVYTPVVVICALLLAVIPPLFLGVADAQVWRSWVYRAMSFLVVSCPCALVISVPMTFFSGIGGMSKRGILVKGSNYIETLSKCDTAVLDKTGTLTTGQIVVTKVYCENGYKTDDIIQLANICESASTHPIAAAIRNYAASADNTRAQTIEELAGYGVHAVVDGTDVYVGNAKLMDKIGVSYKACTDVGSLVYIARANEYMGCIVLSDVIKSDSKRAIDSLKECGIHRIVMLTGDNDAIASNVAAQLGIDEYYSQLLPSDKVTKTETLIQNKTGGSLAFVGDGINDAPVLARADIGIAMGGLGSDAAIEAADVVLMDDNPLKIALAVKSARRIVSIVKQNIIFVLAVKLTILVLVALGAAGMWAAVFADVGVAVLAILNAMRAIRIRQKL